MPFESIDAPGADRLFHRSALSRRALLGGLLTGAALGAAPGGGVAAMRSAVYDVKRPALRLRLGANEN